MADHMLQMENRLQAFQISMKNDISAIQTILNKDPSTAQVKEVDRLLLAAKTKAEGRQLYKSMFVGFGLGVV
jgi:hypothetical protein